MDSWNVADQIDRLIWKNRAMVRITLAASDSHQFKRGVELARTIQNAESRTEALLLMAEAQCHQSDQQDLATATYQAAAEAAAAITQDGLRGVMVGFLVDSLIASGRFDDARACTVLYPEESERFVALGAVAESMGKRGLAHGGSAMDRDRSPPGLSLGTVPSRRGRRALVRRAVPEQGVAPGRAHAGALIARSRPRGVSEPGSDRGTRTLVNRKDRDHVHDRTAAGRTRTAAPPIPRLPRHFRRATDCDPGGELAPLRPPLRRHRRAPVRLLGL